ncbi:hypothetical protein [Microbispora sp. CSR-4]|uniref:hypothetical protein n=1 Tax=Microbispora sp. CSR-4 TaxID=2592813 RepID=UPI0011CB07A4|nr:hypothetical protein [Microbispora sp. CSR-4]
MTEMTETKSVAQAVAEVDRLQAAAEKWAADEVTKTAELEAFEASAAGRLVDDPDAAEELTDEAARLRAGLALTKRTRATAEGQLAEARRGVLLARAAELRAQAVAKRADADDLDEKAAPLLEQLYALMGCRYEPPLDFGTSGVSRVGVSTLTKARILRNQAKHLDFQAEDLERFAGEKTAEQVAAKAAQLRGQAKVGAERVAVS